MPREPSLHVTGHADVVAIGVRVAAEDVDEAPLAHARVEAGTMPGTVCGRSRREAQVVGLTVADSAIGWGVANRRT